MRRARWALHIHYHPPQLAPDAECPEESDQDRTFSVYWKNPKPELSHKMKFFVITAYRALDYFLPGNKTKRWIL